MKHDQEAADRYVRRLLEAEHSLEQFPYRGAPSYTLGDDIRRLVVGDYVIFYDVTPKMVRVLRIFHQREDADSAFDVKLRRHLA
jgi:plasmid stabilization system protein ParE